MGLGLGLVLWPAFALPYPLGGGPSQIRADVFGSNQVVDRAPDGDCGNHVHHGVANRLETEMRLEEVAHPAYEKGTAAEADKI